MRARTRRALIAGLVAATVSGAPSTLHALATGRDPLTATVAAGTLVLGTTAPRHRLVAAAVPVHLALSLGWALILDGALPERRSAARGACAGLAIAALDLGVAGRHFPAVADLVQWPQYADHALYGATIATLTRRSR